MPDKLQKLQKLLTERGLAGFLIPSNDEFQSEYPPESSRRLEWLTGFSGSAGSAIVTPDKAIFFTDGRYTLQAKEQVPDSYERYNIADKKPSDWAKENIKGVLAFDPWLHTENNVKAYAGLQLQEVANLIDELWDDKPSAPSSQIKNHPVEYAGAEMEYKIAEINQKMTDDDVDAFIVTAPDSLCWLLNIRANDTKNTPLLLAYAIVYKHGGVNLFVAEDRVPHEVRKRLGTQVDIYPQNVMKNIIKDMKGKVLLDPNNAPYWFFTNMKKAEIFRARDYCVLPKACKNAVEVSGMINAHKRDGKAVAKFIGWVKENQNNGISELDCVDKLLELRKENELFQEVSFDTIAGFNSNGAIVHYRATEKSNKIIKGDGLLLIDSGGQYLDGTTDITRVVAIGKPSKDQIHDYTLVLKGHIALAMAVFQEGTTGSDLDILARQFLKKEGKDYDHGTGHGVGCYLGVHEGPQRISKAKNDVALLPGMIISNEPGYYKEGEYGIRIENLIVVRDTGNISDEGKRLFCFETITKAPLEEILIDFSMMDAKESSWIEEYKRLYS